MDSTIVTQSKVETSPKSLQIVGSAFDLICPVREGGKREHKPYEGIEIPPANPFFSGYFVDAIVFQNGFSAIAHWK